MQAMEASDTMYKESLPENKQFIEENKKETLAQVFTDVRYTDDQNFDQSAGQFPGACFR